MPLTTSEQTALNQATAAATQAQQAVAVLVAALVADTEPHPLQVALDAMTAERDALQAKINDSKARLDAAAAADVAGDAAEAAEDTARNEARQALE